MGVAKKYKRKICLGDREFLWYVTEDFRSEFDPRFQPVLRVLTPDKQFMIAYQLNQLDLERKLIVMGVEFAGTKRQSSAWLYVDCPKFEADDGSVTPGIVRELIDWCTAKNVTQP